MYLMLELRWSGLAQILPSDNGVYEGVFKIVIYLYISCHIYLNLLLVRSHS